VHNPIERLRGRRIGSLLGWQKESFGRLGPKSRNEEKHLNKDIRTIAERLARDPKLTDYDFWRSLKNIDNAIFQAANTNRPIPIDMIRWRAILNRARLSRQAG